MLIIFAITFVIIILFFLEPIRIDILALCIPIVLVLLEPWTTISVNDALSGFSNKATVTILFMFILSYGIQKNGLIQIIGDGISSINGKRNKRIFLILLAGFLSTFLNNTALVAILIPMVMNTCRKLEESPSKLLMPINFAVTLGGTVTLIGTSTNLLASEVSAKITNHTFTMFEFTKAGFPILIIGLIYLTTIGFKLTPRRIKGCADLTEEYRMEDYLTEVIIGEDSRFIGKSLDSIINDKGLDIEVVKLSSSEVQESNFEFKKVLERGDKLTIMINADTLLKLVEDKDLEVIPDSRVTKENLEEKNVGKELLEVIIPQGSSVEGKTLGEMNFFKRFEALLFAIRRGDRVKRESIDDLVLKAGDVMLLFGSLNTIDLLRNNNDFIIVRNLDTEGYKRSKMIISTAIMVGVILLAALDITHIAIAALIGVIVMVITKCINPSEMYDSVDWKVIFMLAGFVPLGIAMEQTGAAGFLANKLLVISSGFPHIVILAMVYVFTAILTNVISNNASVILMVPIAINIALRIGSNPIGFIVVVIFAASAGFLTPIGYQTNLMIYGPGGYKFKDFMKVGAPLQIILAIITPLIVSLFWRI